MTELQPWNSHQINGNVQTLPPPASASAETLSISAAGSKRLRRPSVRLGEIGGEHHLHGAFDSQGRKSTSNRKDISKSSRNRTLTNLSSGSLGEEREGNVDFLGVGSWRLEKRVGSSTTTAAAKRVRSNWVSKVEEMDRGDNEEEEEELDGGRDFSREDSESPIKEESFGRRRRYESNSGNNRDFEISEAWNMEGGVGREGVKIWLEELGLGRYWPMFEIHEVDEEVLPFLSLEDLKDMGINAVGTRRKMFCAIQKLRREFS